MQLLAKKTTTRRQIERRKKARRRADKEDTKEVRKNIVRTLASKVTTLANVNDSLRRRSNPSSKTETWLLLINAGLVVAVVFLATLEIAL
ncbi:MAG: hypothetical protein GY820_35470 [Gammaproteobacteria bacterium]|nr:hypothetical protein [Gammaproteobacteria bacterium]